MSPTSARRTTAEQLVAAFNAMDVDTIIALRTPDCKRLLIPESMGNGPQDNATYAHSLHQLRHVFCNFTLTITDLLEDSDANRLCLWLHARADTAAGEYINEYVWLLDFDNEGKKIRRSKEYSDTVMYKEFFPKLQAAMAAHEKRARATASGSSAGVGDSSAAGTGGAGSRSTSTRKSHTTSQSPSSTPPPPSRSQSDKALASSAAAS